MSNVGADINRLMSCRRKHCHLDLDDLKVSPNLTKQVSQITKLPHTHIPIHYGYTSRTTDPF